MTRTSRKLKAHRGLKNPRRTPKNPMLIARPEQKVNQMREKASLIPRKPKNPTQMMRRWKALTRQVPTDNGVTARFFFVYVSVIIAALFFRQGGEELHN